MKLKFTFWEISFKDQVLNRTFTFKGAKKWMKKWMEENLNKHYTVFDPEAYNLLILMRLFIMALIKFKLGNASLIMNEKILR